MKRPNRPPFFLLALLCGFSLLTAGHVNSVEAAEAAPLVIENGIWAWSEVVDGQHAILISRQNGTEWQPAEQVSTSDGVAVTPAVVGLNNEGLLVVWSSFTGDRAQLHYRRYQEGGWGEELSYYSGLNSNTAPTAVVDGDGRLWLAWAGFDGVSDQIYFAVQERGQKEFSTATALTATAVPDILPLLGIDEASGRPWLRWQRYSDKGYQLFEAQWTGSGWSEPQAVTDQSGEPSEVASEVASEEAVALMLGKLAATYSRKMAAGTEAETTAATGTNGASGSEMAPEETFTFEIPDMVGDPLSAAVHIPGYAVHSLPLRALGVNEVDE